MTFLTILGAIEILCSFSIVLEGKTDKEITQSSRLKFIEMFSGNNFALSDAEDSTSRLLNRRGIADLPLLRTLLAEVNRAKFLGSNGLFCFISISKFGSFKKPFVTITSLSEFYLRIRKFFSVIQMK